MTPARGPFTVALFLALAATLPAIAASEPPTAQQYYESALARMRALPQPPYATYTTTIRGDNDHVDVSRDPKDGTLEIAIMLGHGKNNNTVARSAYLRASDEAISTQLLDGTHALSHSGMVNPTWWGAYRMIRDGWGAWGGEPAPTPSSGPSSRSQGDAIPTIAVVRAISPGFYRIEDGGGASCADGTPGHRIHLIAYSDPLNHPLTDAIIDTHSQEFCSLRFGLHQSAVIGSATGEMVLDFVHRGPYQVISDGVIGLNLHAMGFKVKHLGVRVEYSDFRFPPSLPSGTFTTQLGPAKAPTPG